MILNLPTPDGTRFSWTVRTPIEDVETDLHYKWNARSSLWTVDISIDGESLVYGRVVRPIQDLLSGITSSKKPDGSVYCFWPGELRRLTAPGLTDFATCRVWYWSSSELAAQS